MTDTTSDTPRTAKRENEELHIVFDGPPSHESGRFVEVEDAHGHGIRVGEWRERKDGLWELVIHRASEQRIAEATDAEATRWQQRLNWIHLKYEVDGSGCDSGDPVDLIEDEIKQALGKQADRIAELTKERDEANRMRGEAPLVLSTTQSERDAAEGHIARITRISDSEMMALLRRRVITLERALTTASTALRSELKTHGHAHYDPQGERGHYCSLCEGQRMAARNTEQALREIEGLLGQGEKSYELLGRGEKT